MKTDDFFETAFSEFIDQKEYDIAQQALFAIIREAFKAGWCAEKSPVSPPAGGAGGSKGAG